MSGSNGYIAKEISKNILTKSYINPLKVSLEREVTVKPRNQEGKTASIDEMIAIMIHMDIMYFEVFEILIIFNIAFIFKFILANSKNGT